MLAFCFGPQNVTVCIYFSLYIHLSSISFLLTLPSSRLADLMRRQEELRRLEELRNQELQRRKQIEMRCVSSHE